MRISTFACLRLLLGCVFLTSLADAQPGTGEKNTNPSTQLASGQQSETQASVPQAPSHQKSEQEKEIEKQEQSQRMLGVVPRFGTTDRQKAAALTPREKFHLFAKSSFDPVALGIVGVQAGLSQAENQFPGYGQGAAGYGKRYGAALADEVSSGFFSNFLYPSMLKHDPRYFRLGAGSLKRRMLYGLTQEFVCHTDKGGRSFNYSNVLGAFSSGGLANVYYPSSDRGFGLTMSRTAIAWLYGEAGGLFDEFWPDIQRKLSRKRKPGASAPVAIPSVSGRPGEHR